MYLQPISTSCNWTFLYSCPCYPSNLSFLVFSSINYKITKHFHIFFLSYSGIDDGPSTPIKSQSSVNASSYVNITGSSDNGERSDVDIPEM